MMCDACLAHVTKALEAVPGVTDVVVRLQPGEAVVRHDSADAKPLTAAIAEAGYEADLAE
jgi:Cu2+-exporting ATPase